ncbi:MAG: type IV pilus secretin PilQ [Candidatus Binatia bacterium]
MMRWSGSGAYRWSIVFLCVAVLAGCARRVVTSEEAVSSAVAPVGAGEQGELTETALAPAVGASATAALDVREIKLIEDNGQHGLFVKLNRAPSGVTHHALTQPNRLVVEIAGGDGEGETSAQKYTVNDPVIHEIRVARHEGKIRLTLGLRGDTVPTCTVDSLNDTVVAFLGEPSGGTQPVREQVVFTRRAVGSSPLETAAAPAAPQPEIKPVQPPFPPSKPFVEREEATAPVRRDDAARVAPGGARQPYHGQHVSLDFKDADIHNVLRLLAEVSKLNIVATDDVRGKVTLRLFDVPWDQALDIVLQVLNLESEQEGNVIRISTVKRLREEREELQKAQEAAKAVEPLRVEYLHVNYAKASKLAEIISGRMAAGATRQAAQVGQVEMGVLTNRGSVFVDEFSSTLVVRDIQRGIDNARELVHRLDVQTPQVLIESNIVEATTTFARDMGVQWGYKHSVGPQTGNPTGVNFPGTIGLGGSGLGAAANGLPFIADFPAAVNPGAGSALDLALGSIDGSQALDIRLSALESQGKARIISRPRVVTLNNVAATIKSLTIIRVKLPSTGTVINTGAGGAAGTASTATEKIETGIILTVTPQVSSDGFVLLDMFAKSSQADYTQQVDNIPTEISREANSHILIKEGQTVVLGGIYRDNVSHQQSGIPFLKDIPGLGWLFRDTNRNDRREDLLVFLTPRIMGGPRQGLPSAEELWTHRQ